MDEKERLEWLNAATEEEIEEWVDAGLRHQSGKEPYEYLKHWLSVARCFGYATHDDSWGEFEKEFAIIIRRLVITERRLKTAERIVEPKSISAYYAGL